MKRVPKDGHQAAAIYSQHQKKRIIILVTSYELIANSEQRQQGTVLGIFELHA